MDWFDLSEVQGTLKSLLQHHKSKASLLWHSAFFQAEQPKVDKAGRNTERRHFGPHHVADVPVVHGEHLLGVPGTWGHDGSLYQSDSWMGWSQSHRHSTPIGLTPIKDITSHWSEWPSSKSLQTINSGEGVEKRECSCTVGGNVN